MKKLFIIFFLVLHYASSCYGRDFIVDFIEENYKETQADFSYQPLIYHSIQVNTSIGPKLLILTGKDSTYRKWVRYYIAQDKKFITKIPDEDADRFLSAKAYEININFLHPINGEKWKIDTFTTSNSNNITDNNHILIIDPNEKKNQLIKLIAERMKYKTDIYKNGDQALFSFRLQPEKFKLIIIRHDSPGLSPVNIIEQILKINHNIPVIVDTGYKNKTIEDLFLSRFSDYPSVHIVPVVLSNLQKTIESLIHKNT